MGPPSVCDCVIDRRLKLRKQVFDLRALDFAIVVTIEQGRADICNVYFLAHGIAPVIAPFLAIRGTAKVRSRRMAPRRSVASLRGTAYRSRERADQKQQQKDHKQDFGDLGKHTGDSAKSKDRGDERHDQKHKCPIQHDRCPPLTRIQRP
jgi:hypothetical protein